MAMNEIPVGKAAASTPRGGRRAGPLRRLWRGFGWFTTATCVAVPVALATGFIWFVSRVPADEIPLDRDADGIVVLTGGASRINDAIELLAAGRGQRLLISGANPTTHPIDILRLNPEFERWIRCCVDFDRSVNTRGNAMETRRWAQSRGFRSLIVVTSSSHAPRHGRDRAPASGCGLDSVSGDFRPAQRGFVVDKRSSNETARVRVSEIPGHECAPCPRRQQIGLIGDPRSCPC